MKQTPQRSFSTAGKVSRAKMAGAAALVSLFAVTAVVVARAGTADPKALAAESGRRVLGAAEAWQSENPVGCPSITELVESGFLDDGARVDDPWGNRFRISCSDRAASVHAAGPDGRFGTADDVFIGG